MDANILCTLLAQRIPPEQFQLWGLDIHWKSSDYDTPENRAIVADVIANYPELAAAYEASQIPVKKQQAYAAEADPIYSAYQAMSARQHPDAQARYNEWEAKILEIQERFKV
jgi:hypothetical protein